MIFIIIFLFFSNSCVNRVDPVPRVVIFSAISLADVIEEIKSSFESEKNVKISVSYSGSQKLARQIAAGANADIFLSAGILPRDFLNELSLVSRTSIFASNRLVLVAAEGFPYETISIYQNVLLLFLSYFHNLLLLIHLF